MLRILWVLLFAAYSLLLGAERLGEIRGTVKSEEGESLEGAQVKIRDSKLGALAAGDGHFVIRNVPAGRHQVIVWMTGYQSQMQRATVWQGAIIQLDFTLKTRVISLEPIEVRGEAFPRPVTPMMVEMEFEKIPIPVEIITEEEIEEMGALTVADALLESQSLYLQGDSERALAASLRGLRTTHTLVLIDGRRVAAGLRDNINLDDIPTSMIERIEIVRGPISALYGSDAIGGAINIITKEPPEEAIAGLTVNYGQSKYGEAQNP
ncbi:TonB-dependent receptor plug domain-containing protein, partial [bacterium]|nr:TonB-dependent receptor plug domain-containing protein [bacterium]